MEQFGPYSAILLCMAKVGVKMHYAKLCFASLWNNRICFLL